MNQQSRKNKNRKQRKNAGDTLIEIIVSFALVAVFFLAASNLLASIIRLYGKMKYNTYAITVSDSILDQISAQISGAQAISAGNDASLGSYDIGIGTVDSGTNTRGNAIACYTREGKNIYIKASSGDSYIDAGAMEDGLLLIHYQSMIGENDQASSGDWVLGSESMMGYHIESLSFSILKEDSNVIRVELIIQRDEYEYEAERYIECYNFHEKADLGQIRESVTISKK